MQMKLNEPTVFRSFMDEYRAMNEKRFTKKTEEENEENKNGDKDKKKSNKREYGKDVVAKSSDCEESVIYEAFFDDDYFKNLSPEMKAYYLLGAASGIIEHGGSEETKKDWIMAYKQYQREHYKKDIN